MGKCSIISAKAVCAPILLYGSETLRWYEYNKSSVRGVKINLSKLAYGIRRMIG